MAEQMSLPAVAAGAAAIVVADGYTRAVATVDYVARVAHKLERVLDETIETLQVARPVIVALGRALEEGRADDGEAAARPAARQVRRRRGAVTADEAPAVPPAPAEDPAQLTLDLA